MSQDQSFAQALLTLLLPFSISLALYLFLSYILIPFLRNQSENLPLDTVNDLASRAKSRVGGWLSKIGRRREEDWDDDVGEEEEDPLAHDFDEERRGGIWRGR